MLPKPFDFCLILILTFGLFGIVFGIHTTTTATATAAAAAAAAAGDGLEAAR